MIGFFPFSVNHVIVLNKVSDTHTITHYRFLGFLAAQSGASGRL